MWEHGDPAATEACFREALPSAAAGGDRAYHGRTRNSAGRSDDARPHFVPTRAPVYRNTTVLFWLTRIASST